MNTTKLVLLGACCPPAAIVVYAVQHYPKLVARLTEKVATLSLPLFAKETP